MVEDPLVQKRNEIVYRQICDAVDADINTEFFPAYREKR